MKTLLTGHQGFIGSHYYRHIIDQDPYAYDISTGTDLCDQTVVNQLPDCDILVHMAATNGTRLFYEIPIDVAMNNTLPTLNLLKRYLNTGTKFVFTSSCEIFNSTTDAGLYPVPTDENVPIMFNDITNPRWSYSIPKALGENLVINSGLEWLIIRYFNVYGPGQKDHFIQEFVNRVKQGEYYINGDDTRSFCYVQDAVEITEKLIKNVTREIVNVGNQEETKISDVARIILDIMGVDPNRLEIRPSPKGSAKRRCPDLSKMRRLVNHSYNWDLHQGLKRTIESL